MSMNISVFHTGGEGQELKRAGEYSMTKGAE